VRLSGQDARRGTFTHRHAVLHDVEDGSSYVPLSISQPRRRASSLEQPAVGDGRARLRWGYSLDYPRRWCVGGAVRRLRNGAQVIIDQFLAPPSRSGAALGPVLLLPHGFEGQGPEHSSARLERFLSLAARDNIQVRVPRRPRRSSTLLRRQVAGPGASRSS
jgi:2-oxoglutarate dehydrogenase E1 component